MLISNLRNIVLGLPVDSKTRTYNGKVGLGCTARQQDGVGQDRTPTEQFAQDTCVPRTIQGIEDSSPQRLSRSTNKRNSM